jgi:hypothetical protein
MDCKEQRKGANLNDSRPCPAADLVSQHGHPLRHRLLYLSGCCFDPAQNHLNLTTVPTQ